MSIADELSTSMKSLLDATYVAGGGGGGGQGLLNYISGAAGSFENLFYGATFPSGYNAYIDTPKAPASLVSMFRVTTGLEKLTFFVPTDKVYNASYFMFGSTTAGQKSTIKEIHLPDGIKFSKFDRFVSNCESLRSIYGKIDLSESTTNDICFMSCFALVDVEFVKGSITQSLYLKQSSRLSDASIASILEGLSLEATGQTLTLHSSVAARIDEREVTDRGWTLVY